MKYVSLVIFLLGLSFQVSAETYVKEDGNPCVDDICIGDDINALIKKNIKWKPVSMKYASKVDAKDIDSYKKDFAPQPSANFSGFIPYIRGLNSTYQIDQKGLIQMSKINGFCKGFFMVGNFVSKGGNKTEVTIRVIPSDDGLTQRALVESIGRYYPSNITPEQKFELESEFTQRYNQVRRKGVYDPRLENSEPIILGKKEDYAPFPTWSFNGNLLLAAPFNQYSRNYSQEYLKYPGCAAKVNLD